MAFKFFTDDELLTLSNSEFGRDWISNHTPENAVTFGQDIVVERRFIGAIIRPPETMAMWSRC
jgi:hypothetical protein